jgi:hypothetical protein
MKAWLVLLLPALALAACTFSPLDNAQTRAGITDVSVEFCAIGPVEAPTAYAPCEISYVDGKERTDVRLSADLGNGIIEYEAGGSLAFDGQAIRGAVERALADAQVEATGELVDAILEALRLGVVPL